METVEHFAKIALTAQQLGTTNTLSGDQVQDLLELRTRFGIAGRPGCELGGAPASTADGSREELVELITGQVLQHLKGQ